LGLGGTVSDGTPLLAKLNQVIGELGFKEYTSTEGNRLNTFMYTMSLMIGTAGLPHVIVRFFTVPTVKDARSSAGWALVFIAILYTTAPAVAAMARMNLVSTLNPGAISAPEGSIIGTPEGTLSYEARPQWFKNWETTGLLKFEDKNGDGLIQYYNDKNPEFKTTADAHGWAGSELVVDRDIIVLANPDIAGLPNWVIALVAAGGLAAALSTAAGLLLAISSAVSHDLVKGIIAPNISDSSELMIGRISMGVAIGVAGYLGLHPPGFAAGTVALAFGLAASSLFPAIMMGIFTKRINRAGAIAGMISGITVTLLYIFQHKGIMFIPGTSFLGDMEPNWLGGITPNAFGTVGAIVNFTVAFLVSRVTAEPPLEIQDLVEGIRVPQGSGGATH
jgi:cation/acetate symporter